MVWLPVADAVPTSTCRLTGDGRRLDTLAIQAALNACSAGGGGRVALSAGVFLTGTLYLRSGVELYLAEDATLLASADIGEYGTDTHKNMYKDEPHMDQCLIFGRDLHNVAITGAGTIDGSGSSFPDPLDAARRRPMLLRLVNCVGVQIAGVRLRDPAAWTCAFLYCTDIDVRLLDIQSRANENGDGLDFDGCRDVRVADCTFDTSDDSICFQTSLPDRPCKNLRVARCEFKSRWAGIRVGLLSRGEISDLLVENCSFREIEDSGVKVQMCEGGRIADLTFRHLTMTGVTRPVFITLCSQRACVDGPPGYPPLGCIEGVVFEDLIADSSSCGPDSMIVLTGAETRPLRGCSFRRLDLRTGGDAAADVLVEVPELNRQTLGSWWPEYSCFGGTVPSHGIYARHVDGLLLDDVSIHPDRPDSRAAFAMKDVTGMVVSSQEGARRPLFTASRVGA